MANPYSCTLIGLADDGTNTYCVLQVSNGQTTMQPFQAVFPSSPSKATVQSYMQNIANNQPTIAASLGTLLNSPVLGQ